jgi:hypothetical protein
MANLLFRLIKADFLNLVLISYWFTNVAGIVIMYAAGKDMVNRRTGLIKEVLSLIVTGAIYSFIIVLIVRLGILKPLP